MRGIFVFAFILLSTPSVAQTQMDTDSQKALQQTLQLLKNPQLRQQAIRKNPKAQRANEAVESLGTKEQQQRIYELAAEIMQGMAQKTGGDVGAMKQSLQESPESFYQSLSPEQKAKIRELASEIQSQGRGLHP